MHGDLDLIPSWGTKIPRAEWCGQKIKKKKFKGGGKKIIYDHLAFACGRMTI